MATKPKYGLNNYVKRGRRKRPNRHAKNPNPKHKIFKKYRGQGR